MPIAEEKPLQPLAQQALRVFVPMFFWIECLHYWFSRRKGAGGAALALLLLPLLAPPSHAALTATAKGPNQINLTWSAVPDPRYGYLVEIQSAADARYGAWTEWRPVPLASGYTCDPSILVNGAACTISDPTGAHIHKPASNGVPWWVTEPTYLDPQDGTPAQFIAHGLKPGTAYSFRMRTYTGNASPVYGAYSNTAAATTSAYPLRYVSMTGTDANDGTAADDAHSWRTLNQTSKLICGQALIVQVGTYGGLNLAQTCTPDQKVVVMADPGALVTLTGPVGLSGHSLVLDGLTVRASLGGGDFVVNVSGTGHALLGVDVGSPVIPGITNSGVQINWGTSILVYGSSIHDFGSPDATQNPGGNSGFMFVVTNSTNNVVWSNHFTRGGHDTGLCKGGCLSNRWLNNILDGGWSMGWEAIEGSTGNLVEGNTIKDPGQLVTAYKPGMETSSAGNTIRRNLILNAKAGAVEVSAIEGGDTVIGTRIYNNTIYRPGSCMYESSNGGEGKYAGLIFSNNLCYKTTQSEAGFGLWYSRNPTSQISFNSVEYVDADDVLQPGVKAVRYYGGSEYATTLALAEANPAYAPFANNLALSAVRPQFVDEAGGDFHLLPASPLRGKGIAIVDTAWPFPSGALDVGIGSPAVPVAPAVTLLSIACGGEGDMGFSGGAPWGADQVQELDAMVPPYRSMRYSTGRPFSYQFVSSGNAVTLQFLEPRMGQVAGARVFDVAVNGVIVLPALDLAAVAGPLVPKEYTFPVAAGLVTVKLTPVKGNAILSGIEILAAGCR